MNFALAATAFSVAACAIPPIPSRVVYEDPVNFVRTETDFSVLEDIPETHFSHPIDISPKTMAAILKGLMVRDRGPWLQRWIVGVTEDTPAFQEREVEFLAPKLADALSRARHTERVAFYLSYPQTSIKREITTGGVYVRGHELHVMLANHRVIYGIPAYGMVYDRRYPLMPTAPKIFELTFVQPDAIVPTQSSLLSRLLGAEPDELVIDLQRVRSSQSVV